MAVLESEGNLIDVAKELPEEIWNNGVFDLSLNMTIYIDDNAIISETNINQINIGR